MHQVKVSVCQFSSTVIIDLESGIFLILALKGQVTFLKLCLLVVCLALIIPRFTLF